MLIRYDLCSKNEDLRTNKAVRVKKYEWEGRYEREGKGTSSRVGVKEYQGDESMNTKTKHEYMNISQDKQRMGQIYERGDTGTSARL